MLPVLEKRHRHQWRWHFFKRLYLIYSVEIVNEFFILSCQMGFFDWFFYFTVIVHKLECPIEIRIILWVFAVLWFISMIQQTNECGFSTHEITSSCCRSDIYRRFYVALNLNCSSGNQELCFCKLWWCFTCFEVCFFFFNRYSISIILYIEMTFFYASHFSSIHQFQFICYFLFFFNNLLTSQEISTSRCKI